MINQKNSIDFVAFLYALVRGISVTCTISFNSLRKVKYSIFVFIMLLTSGNLFSQNDPTWDDTVLKNWPKECENVLIVSSVDEQQQPAYFYSSRNLKPVPLIVSLHTWSGSYIQRDTLSWQCIERDINYIHPDFRGSNNTYEACGSPLVISDIDDAIDFAIANGNVDLNEIHVIGVSGGGYATLLMYMKSKHKIKTFSAWASISNIEEWYWESKGREQKYYMDIAKATSKDGNVDEQFSMNVEEARKRSPILKTVPAAKRENSKLYIFGGVHDGYTGSVPITHSLKFYNKAITDWGATQSSLISDDTILKMVTYRMLPNSKHGKIDNRQIYYANNYQGKVLITMFEGGHEMLTGTALDFMKSKGILLVGDSNGALKNGWGELLTEIRKNDFVFNTSISGNTIGFKNGSDRYNTLKNIDNYLDSCNKAIGQIDEIVVMLGTNDCKAIFNKQLKEVPGNLTKLIRKIKSHRVYNEYHPEIIIVSPPPQASDEKLKAKYHGGKKSIEYLIPEFEKIAKKEGCTYVDVYSVLDKQFDEFTIDGIHMNIEGQSIVAEKINAALLKTEK